MAYKNKVYISMEADSDLKYYNMMIAWKVIDKNFTFYNAHEINTITDKSEESIKAGLMERFRNTKIFILLVGEKTKNHFKYVRWEIEQAIKRKLPIIVVNLNKNRRFDDKLCPPILDHKIAIHISYNKNIIKYALDNWPARHEKYLTDEDAKSYYYSDEVYKKLEL